MSTDIPNSDVTYDAAPTMPREVQPVFHENNDLSSVNSGGTNQCQSYERSITTEEIFNSHYSLTSNSTEDTLDHSDRQSQIKPADANESNNQRSKLPPKPPEDWQFNHLLLEISKCVSEDFLEDIKSLFRGHGEGSIGKRRLQECRSCIQFFTLLRENLYLSKDNTLYLQKFLYKLGNRDLIKKTIQYCKKQGNLYFYNAEEEPVQGSTPVMFHVKGKDLKDFTPEFVREVRDTVAAILCVPHEHVLIAGLKPSDSFLILLIIPDVYVEIFQQMLIEKEEMFPLTKKDIDYIEINNTVYYIMVTDVDSGFPTSKQQRKLQDAYQRLEDTQRQLEAKAEQANERLHAVEFMENQIQCLQNEIRMLKADTKRLTLENSSLKKMDTTIPTGELAIEELRNALQEAERYETDVKLIQRIINANTSVVSTHLKYENEGERELIAARWKKKMAQNEKLFQELISRKKSPEDILLIKYTQCTLVTKINLNEHFRKVLADISTRISDRERHTLMKRYQWKDKDIIKACVDEDKKVLLLGLFCKNTEQIEEETEQRKEEVSIETVLAEIFEEINRRDLYEMFEHKMKDRLFEIEYSVHEYIFDIYYHFLNKYRQLSIGEALTVDFQHIPYKRIVEGYPKVPPILKGIDIVKMQRGRNREIYF